jgi:hypothetical protein
MGIYVIEPVSKNTNLAAFKDSCLTENDTVELKYKIVLGLDILTFFGFVPTIIGSKVINCPQSLVDLSTAIRQSLATLPKPTK